MYASYIDASRWKRKTVHVCGFPLWTYLENNVLILLRVSNKTPPNTDSIPRAILFDCSLPALGSSLALLF